MNIYFGISIGKQAYDQLRSSSSFVVLGNTSKGVFIKSPPRGLIFLSYENFRGPLTINIGAEEKGILSEMKPGSIVRYIRGEGFTFSDKQIQVELDKIASWTPDSYSPIDDGMFYWNNLKLIQDWLRTNTPIGSFGYMSSNIPENAGFNNAMKNEVTIILQNAYTSIKEYDYEKFCRTATSLIGLGPGLTPSGDDFLSGMGLAVSRYSEMIMTLKKYLPWFDALIPIFYRKTTMLSAALYSASVSGTADERLITAFDAIMRKDVSIEDVILNISTWGSSSGFDSISGFYILMKAVEP